MDPSSCDGYNLSIRATVERGHDPPWPFGRWSYSTMPHLSTFRRLILALSVMLVLSGCGSTPSPTSEATPTTTASAASVPTPQVRLTSTVAPTATPTRAAPTPTLSPTPNSTLTSAEVAYLARLSEILQDLRADLELAVAVLSEEYDENPLSAEGLAWRLRLTEALAGFKISVLVAESETWGTIPERFATLHSSYVTLVKDVAESAELLLDTPSSLPITQSTSKIFAEQFSESLETLANLEAAIARAMEMAPAGGEQVTPAPTESAGQALTRNWEYVAKGQWGRRWDQLHPVHQEIVPREMYVECFQGEIVPITHIEVLEEYDEPDVLPEIGEVSTTAVTVALEIDGQQVVVTSHMVNVEGTWRWVLREQDLDAFKAGRCP